MLRTLFLYSAIVLIWGMTWIACKLQVPYASTEVSVFYRQALTAMGLFSLMYIKKMRFRYTLKDHLFFALLGCTMFSIHFFFLYEAFHYITSGVSAVVVSAGIFLCSVLNNFLFFKVRPTRSIILGVVTGVAGLLFFFYKEVTAINLHEKTFYAITLSAIASVIFSFGAVISRRNKKKGLPTIPYLAFGSFYGALILLIIAFFHDVSFVIPTSLLYWETVLYLSLFGSVIGFYCYFILIETVGMELAGYATLLPPVIALCVSSFFENYTWTYHHLFGLILILIGNFLVFYKKSAIPA